MAKTKGKAKEPPSVWPEPSGTAQRAGLASRRRYDFAEFCGARGLDQGFVSGQLVAWFMLQPAATRTLILEPTEKAVGG